MLVSIIAGVLTGFIVSIPPLGPISFTIISKGFNNKIKEGMSIGTGAAFMDFVYCLAAFGGLSLIFSLLPESLHLFYSKHINLVQVILTYTGCLIVVIYGIIIIRKKISFEELESRQSEKVLEAQEKAQEVEDKAKEFAIQHHVPVITKTSLTGLFIMGILLCFSSITLPASWVAVVGYLKGYKIIDSSFIDGLYFSAGVFAGTSTWFYTLMRLITGNKHRIRPASVQKLNLVSGVALIILGVFLFAKAAGITFSKL